MCTTIIVKATTDTGEPHPDAPDSIYYDEDEASSTETGVCSCWRARPGPEGDAWRLRFMNKAILPFLEKVAWGDIRILIR